MSSTYILIMLYRTFLSQTQRVIPGDGEVKKMSGSNQKKTSKTNSTSIASFVSAFSKLISVLCGLKKATVPSLSHEFLCEGSFYQQYII